tara:strand:- start:418 stop:1065 length:648 start_codon:yes stop_codon:yes gene_type:complete
MDEDISIISTESRIDKVKKYLINSRKQLTILIITILLILIGFFGYSKYLNEKRLKLSELYNTVTFNFISGQNQNTKDQLIYIINAKDSTYSPLALYFVIENDIISSKKQINEYFDVIINEVNLDKEIKYLIIYKKALFNSENKNENELLEIINPLLKSNSIWKSHALYLMAEYYYANEQFQKAKEFYTQIINLEKVNNKIKIESQKKLNRNLSEK